MGCQVVCLVALLGLLVASSYRVSAFYIPGVAPTEYTEGGKLEIRVRTYYCGDITGAWFGRKQAVIVQGSSTLYVM